MEREKNLYMFVYRMILTDIYNGSYAHNEKLPILIKLCEKYDVGRNTVRSALSELQANGYVTLQKGVQATVIFNVRDLNENVKYRQDLMNLKDITKDVYQTMEMIIPELLIRCYHKGIDIDSMKKLLYEFNIENIHSETEMIQKMYEIYVYVFHASKNPLLVDMFHTLLSYAYQPLTPEVQTFQKLNRSVKGIHKGVSIILKLAQNKQDKLVKSMISTLIKAHSKHSMKYIDSLCEGMEANETVNFIWVCNREHEYLYANVVLSMLGGIVDKTYPMGKVLPSIAQLSQIYGVSDRTSRKALQILREYHVIETINGLGSRVIKTKFDKHDDILKDSEVKESLMAYYYTLQIFCVIFDIVAPQVLRTVNEKELKEFASTMRHTNPKSLSPLSEFIFSRTNRCLHTIFTEMLNTLEWATFVNMFGDNTEEMRLRHELLDALQACKISSIIKICQDILNIDWKQVKSILQIA